MPDPLPHGREPTSAFLPSAAAASTKLLQDIPGRGQTPWPSLRPPEQQHVLSEDVATMPVVAQSAVFGLLAQRVARSVARVWSQRAAQDQG